MGCAAMCAADTCRSMAPFVPKIAPPGARLTRLLPPCPAVPVTVHPGQMVPELPRGHHLQSCASCLPLPALAALGRGCLGLRSTAPCMPGSLLRAVRPMPGSPLRASSPHAWVAAPAGVPGCRPELRSLAGRTRRHRRQQRSRDSRSSPAAVHVSRGPWACTLGPTGRWSRRLWAHWPGARASRQGLVCCVVWCGGVTLPGRRASSRGCHQRPARGTSCMRGPSRRDTVNTKNCKSCAIERQDPSEVCAPIVIVVHRHSAI